MFFKGFRVFREYRLLADTPEIPIRSIPMGLVRVRGRAAGDERVASPVTHTPCYFYKVEIEEWRVKNNSGSWHPYKTDASGVRFYLDDGSGKVLVDAHNAEYDLEKSCEREAGHGAAQPLGDGATEQELLRYVSKVAVARVFSWIGRGLAAAGHQSDPGREQMRQTAAEAFQQPSLMPQFFAQMVAAQLPLAERKLREMGPQSDPQKEKHRLDALEGLKYPVGSPEFIEHFRHVLDADHKPEEAHKFVAFMEAVKHPEQVSFEEMIPPATGRYRFTEYCIVPDRPYDITGTCVENPAPKDEHDRNLIMRGENEPTFLISWKTEKGVESDLRRRAAGYVFGGAALAVVCLGIFLAKFGWLV